MDPRGFTLNPGETITIYMDESWPESRKYGVMAGLVWKGAGPDTGKLPLVRQHLRSLFGNTPHHSLPKKEWPEAARSTIAQLNAARDCCLPFIFRFVPREGQTPQEAYEQMVYDSLLLLLGWELPVSAEGDPVQTQVVCEAIDQVFAHGAEYSDKFEGVLAQASRGNPERFERFQVRKLTWRQKSTEDPTFFSETEIKQQGYLGYADLLAFLALGSESPKAQMAAEVSDVKSLATYLEIDSNTIVMLDRLETCSGRELVGVLEFLVNNRLHVTGKPDNAVTHAVVERLKARMVNDPRLAQDLLELLDDRYMDKERDLCKLDRQFAVVRRLVGELPAMASNNLKLLDLVVKLQRSNHLGDPHALIPLEIEFADSRRIALDNGQADLVAHVDLNLSVCARDRFQPDLAAKIANRLLNEESRFSLVSRAKTHSSVGQDLSMLGDFAAARKSFDSALGLLARADLAETERQDEWDQTAIYRAINAIDAGDAGAPALVEEVIERSGLGKLANAAKALATGCPIQQQYRHHLLLRLLHARSDLVHLRKTYVEAMRPDSLPQHPWELICLYRALLAHAHGNDPKVHFQRGIEVATASQHGPTLRTIAAMIATVGWAVCRDAAVRRQANKLILGDTAAITPSKPLTELLPATAPMVKVWQEVLFNPNPTEVDVSCALVQLKFNYR